MHRLRLVTLTTCLATVAAATVAASAGVGPAPADALRGYAHAHGLAPDVDERKAAAPLLQGATPRAKCGPGSLPETGRQGRVPAAEYANGRAAKGYECNAEEVAHVGKTGGFQVHRYVDKAGRVCAFYDATTLFPEDARNGHSGSVVLDMSNPAKPVQTDVLRSPAMLSTHESLRVNHARGLLIAALGSPLTQAGFVDVYDVSQDCRKPVLQSSLPIGGLGHEGGFSPDGRTYWVATTVTAGITAIDVTDPKLPKVIWRSNAHTSHGMAVSDDGNRLYLTDTSGSPSGLRILDVSEVQARVLSPTVKDVSFLTWPEVSIPQNVIPVTIKGRKYLVEFDEYSQSSGSYDPASPVGAVRIIDVSDETKPKVISRIRLEVHEPAARADDQKDDPNAQFGVQGYAAHYCSVPRKVDPGILACSMILSGLRVIDIRDPYKPREAAYFNRVLIEGIVDEDRGGFAMSAPAFDPARGEVWYTDSNSGFFNVRLTNGAWPRSGRYAPHY